MNGIQKTAIILVTYGQWEKTKNCLDDLFKQPLERFQVFVVDNGSPDETPRNIAQEFPSVKLFCPGKNLGFGAANNLGIAYAEKSGIPFDSILVLNNDVRVPPGTLEALQQDLSQFSGHIISPQLRNTDGSIQKSWFSKIPPWQFFLNAFRTKESAARYVHGKISPVKDSPILEAQWTNAAAWLMTFKTWKQVGSFDENFFMYYEDVDWAYRARISGIRFFIDPRISITHLDGGSAQNILSRSLQHDSSQLYFYRKHLGFKGAQLSRIFRMSRSLVRIILLLPKVFFSKEARKNAQIHLVLFLFSLGLFKFKR